MGGYKGLTVTLSELAIAFAILFMIGFCFALMKRPL
jgi:hypothetical protein